ncbi:hypothetical protein [Candidatus Laterigemmans baculatus]|uniref:hypothetical protein n=1 Tax=Candidatus Laterigemmans baculatus TaxID=2770505 RepID=UPI0013DCAC57|nr:hypothetical protein [Candidatus Laterigemmans baculatus]
MKRKAMSTVNTYALSPDRSRRNVEGFLDHFMRERTPCADEFEYPQYSDAPDAVYPDTDSLLERLEREKHASYSVYWNPRQLSSRDDIAQAMVFYTSSSELIMGLEVPERFARKVLMDFCDIFDARWAYITGDECPPGSGADFQRIVRDADLPHIAEGVLVD